MTWRVTLLGLALLTPALADDPPLAGDPPVSAPSTGDPRGAPAGRTYLLAFGKALVVDPPWMQQLAVDSVRRVAAAARSASPESQIEALTEEVMTRAQLMSGAVKPRLSGALFKARLAALARTASEEDTVVIYTHTHGRAAGFEPDQPLGGLVLDLPQRAPAHRGTTLWSELAELILALPARNVIVATMACFSGGLIDYLDRPAVRRRWSDRSGEGRNLVVLTSQSSVLPSSPIVKDGERINPFTYTVVKMLGGQADGFALEEGRPARSAADGALTIGELVDYVLFTTKNVPSEVGRNTAEPRVGGTFDREQVLGFGAAPRR